MVFRFDPEYVTVPAFGSLVGHADVAIEPDGLILFVAGNTFNCQRSN
jgi:hypothetical protein